MGLTESGAGCGFGQQDLQADFVSGVPVMIGSSECVDLKPRGRVCGEISVACSRPGDVLATGYYGVVDWGTGSGRMTVMYPACTGEFAATVR